MAANNRLWALCFTHRVLSPASGDICDLEGETDLSAAIATLMAH